MADLLKTGSDWLEGMRVAHASRTVTYYRGVNYVEVQATPGETTFEVDTEGGTIERIESRDFLILAANLILLGMETLPHRGDRVKEPAGAGGSVLVYEVMSPGDGPPWRYSDTYRKTLRLHTKLLGTEP